MFTCPLHSSGMRRKRYASRTQRSVSKSTGMSPVNLIAGAAIIGSVVGIGSVAATPEGRESISTMMSDVAKAADLRSRPPQAGDHWSGCNAARAAGTHPIYVGEPGYRSGMDGDGDGIACEPYHEHGRRGRWRH